jgi:hypothetical protein
MALLIQDSNHKKEHARAETVINHLQHRPAQALLAATENTQNNKTHMGDGRISHQAFDIFLN